MRIKQDNEWKNIYTGTGAYKSLVDVNYDDDNIWMWIYHWLVCDLMQVVFSTLNFSHLKNGENINSYFEFT